MRKRILAAVAAAVLGSILAAGAGHAAPPASLTTVSAVPIEGLTASGGKKLWVHVFYAKENEKGKGGGKPKPAPACPDDVNTQDDYLLFGRASTSGLDFRLYPSGAPSGAAVGIQAGVDAWNGVETGYFSLATSGGASRPADDDVNSIGWARFAQPRVLAAAWTWTDASGRIDESDIFFNTRYTWANLTACGGSSYDIASIAAHELGHAAAIDHVSDPERQATMYPSAPAGEILKRTLTVGDENGLTAALQ
jgi:hypothetical protein